MGISKSETDPRFINKVLLEGNDNVTMNEVLYIVRQRPPNFFFRKPKFDDRLLRLDALTLKNYYHSKGFLNVKINDSFKEIEISNKRYVDILFSIDEGKQFFLSKVNIVGNNIIEKERIREVL
jgi:outer membrane protein assembly factor BamA